MRIRPRVLAPLISIALVLLLLTSGNRMAASPGLRFSLILFATTAGAILFLRGSRSLTLKDPRVGRRLIVLLIFATLVPAVLVGALGGMAAWLGAASDRALSAARAYQSEAGHLGDELAVALEGARDEGALAVAARLRAVAAAHARRGESLSVWVRDGDWKSVTGEFLLDSRALGSWPSDSAAASTIVIIHEDPYVAAYVGSRVDSAGLAAVALVPADGAMKKAIAARLGTSLDLPRYTLDTSKERKGGIHFTAPGSRGGVQLTARTGSPDSAGTGHDRTVDLLAKSPFRGFAASHGWLWDGEAWSETDQFVAAQIPFAASMSGLWRNASVTPVALIPLFFLALFFFLGIRILVVNGQTLRAIGKSITSAVAALRGGVDALQKGHLEHRIQIAGSDELWDVAAGFNHAAEGLIRGRLAELEEARLKGDLELARRIQERLLPAAAPEVPGLQVAGLSLPALQVGGDYYDHVLLGDGRVALVTADVSGKGVPAALLMSAFRASLLAQLDSHSDPAHAMANVNRFLHRSVEPGRFVTAFLAIVDGRDGRIEYCNAGHNPPFLVNGAGGATPLEAGGLLLAMMEEIPYERGEARLEPGVTLVIYSDGAVEARTSDDSMWGEERLCKQVRESAGEPCARAAERIASTIRDFEGSQGPSDDLTLLLARRKG